MTEQHPTTGRDLLGLAVFVVGCLAIGGAGGAITATSVATWYAGLAKPAFSPPDWAFGPVWTALYAMMAVAAWRVWRVPAPGRRRALGLFAVQLGLNLGWTALFFGLRRVDLAAVEVFALLAAIMATAVAFWRIDRPAGALMVPYGAWVAFAAVLTVAIWRLNPA